MPRYEFSEGTSNKFWDIELNGSSFTTTYGKIGSSGSTTLKEFKSDAEAKKEYDKLVAEKTKKGYALVGGGKPAAAPAKAAAKPAKKPAERAEEDDDDSGDDDDDDEAPKAKGKPAAAGGGLAGERYFEFIEGTSSKFWAISMEGSEVSTRYGKIGTPGQKTLKEFDGKAAAFKEFDKLVAEKTKKGYEEKTAAGGGGAAGGKGGGATGKSNPQLEKAIVANPEDRDAWSVYADWLESEGDPRGQLIALHLAGKAKAAQAHLDKHAGDLLGPLAEHPKTHDGRDQDTFTWKNGFIHGLRLSHDSYGDEEFEGSLAEILEELLRHPSGKFLAELTMVWNGDPNEDDLQDLIDILAKKAPPTLRKIHIGDFKYNGEETEMSWFHVGKLGKLWKAVPQLTHLIVQGGEFDLGTIELPNLVSARFKTGGLAKASAKAIAAAKWPKLEELEVWYGDDNYGGDATVKDVEPLLARTDLRSLKKLGLKNAQFTDALCGLVADCKLVKQLTDLDLSMGCMTDEGAQALAAGKANLAHLASLDVSRNYLTDASQKVLKGCAKRVDYGAQRDDEDPEYRHPAVGE
jgi:uncharacterized protein (TIGR02996 family)